MILYNFKISPFEEYKSIITQLMISYNKKEERQIFNEVIENNKCQMMNELIEYLITYNKEDIVNFDSLIEELIKRKYMKVVKNTRERKQFIEEIIALSSLKKLKNSYSDKLLQLNLLNVNFLLSIVDLKLFLQYIEYPLFNNSNLLSVSEHKLNTSIKSIIYDLQCLFRNCDKEEYEESIIEKILKHFILFDNIPLSTFTPYFNAHYLNNIYFKCLFMKGTV